MTKRKGAMAKAAALFACAEDAILAGKARMRQNQSCRCGEIE
jgi:hypothetical protein